jgi:hypothetical protein
VVGPLAQPLERGAADGLERGVAGNRAERACVARPRERAQRDDLARRALGDLREHARVADRIDGLEAVGFRRALERLQGEIAQHAARGRADPLVAVVAGDDAERRRVQQLADRGTPDARILVLARDRRNQLAFVERKLGDVGESNSRVRMLVACLGAEPIEQCHTGAPAWSRRPACDGNE